jgi:glutamine synthetase adenylyltransferase
MEAIEAARTRAMSVLAERAPAVCAALSQLPADIAASLPGVLAVSDFLLDALCRDEALIATLASRAGERFAGAPIALPALPVPPSAPAANAPLEAPFMAALRRWRRGEFARIAWRDLRTWHCAWRMSLRCAPSRRATGSRVRRRGCRSSSSSWRWASSVAGS